MGKTISRIMPGCEIVTKLAKDDRVAYMVRQANNYAVFMIQGQTAFAPNFAASGSGIIVSPLLKKNMADFLQWTSHDTARTRFRFMVAAQAATVHHLDDFRVP